MSTTDPLRGNVSAAAPMSQGPAPACRRPSATRRRRRIALGGSAGRSPRPARSRRSGRSSSSSSAVATRALSVLRVASPQTTVRSPRSRRLIRAGPPLSRPPARRAARGVSATSTSNAARVPGSSAPGRTTRTSGSPAGPAGHCPERARRCASISSELPRPAAPPPPAVRSITRTTSAPGQSRDTVARSTGAQRADPARGRGQVHPGQRHPVGHRRRVARPAPA